MKNNKIYIVLLVIIFVFFIVMFSLFGIGNIKQENYKGTYIIGDNTVWKYEQKKWINLRMKSSLEELSWNDFIIYSNHEKIGQYSLWYSDNKWYAFDKEKNAISIPGTIFAYDTNFNLNISIPERQDVEDYTYVYQVLKENNIPTNSELSSCSKTSFDFDKDGMEEDFYVVSNALLLSTSIEKTFSIAFMAKNNTITMIYQNIDDNKYFDGCKPYYNYFLDTNNDGIYEILLSCGKYSNLDQIDMLYQYTNNDFKNVISNQ